MTPWKRLFDVKVLLYKVNFAFYLHGHQLRVLKVYKLLQ